MTGPTREDAAPTIEAAHEIGANGGPVVEAERLAFEAWMHGHCWSLGCEWNGKGYRSKLEVDGYVSPVATHTRGMWAAWRDRAALAFAAGSRSSEPEHIAFLRRWMIDAAKSGALSQCRTAGEDARDAVLDLLETMYRLWENGTDCYEDPEDCTGYLGKAVDLDNPTERKIADLLNEHRPAKSEIDAAMGGNDA